MDAQLITAAHNHAYEIMLLGQYMMDRATTDSERMVADCVYYSGWSTYWMMVELGRMKRKPLHTTEE